jgi:hypothetical protein
VAARCGAPEQAIDALEPQDAGAGVMGDDFLSRTFPEGVSFSTPH